MRGRKGEKIINNDIIDDEEIWTKTPFLFVGRERGWRGKNNFNLWANHYSDDIEKLLFC